MKPPYLIGLLVRMSQLRSEGLSSSGLPSISLVPKDEKMRDPGGLEVGDI